MLLHYKKSCRKTAGQPTVVHIDCLETPVLHCVWETLWIRNESSLLETHRNRCYARVVISHRPCSWRRKRIWGQHWARCGNNSLCEDARQTASRKEVAPTSGPSNTTHAQQVSHLPWQVGHLRPLLGAGYGGEKWNLGFELLVDCSLEMLFSVQKSLMFDASSFR